MPEKIVIIYISRQSAHKRKLLEEDHEAIIRELMALVERKNTERKAGGEKKKVEVELVKDEREMVAELSELSWQRRPLANQSGNFKSSKRSIRPRTSKSALLLGRPSALFSPFKVLTPANNHS